MFVVRSHKVVNMAHVTHFSLSIDGKKKQVFFLRFFLTSGKEVADEMQYECFIFDSSEMFCAAFNTITEGLEEGKNICYVDDEDFPDIKEKQEKQEKTEVKEKKKKKVKENDEG
jgi:hypothetical protein